MIEVDEVFRELIEGDRALMRSMKFYKEFDGNKNEDWNKRLELKSGVEGWSRREES